MSADALWVTFDCFGTLIDWHSGFSAVIRSLVGDRTPDVLHAYHRHERLLEAEAPHRLYRDVLVAALARAASDLGIPLSDSEAQRLPDSWAALPMFADTEPMLADLRSRGYRLAVLTNCDEALFEQTHRTFCRRFDLIVTAERVRDYKPARSHFRFFARTTGASVRDWVHVACSWYHDIEPARALGIERVWLDRDGTGEDPATASAHVRSAAEVGAVVAALLAAVQES
jgi:2-haloacid dehalogenase